MKMMSNKAKLALLGCGAFLLVNNIKTTSKYNKIDEKLEHLTKHVVTHEWETTIRMQKEVMDSLQNEITIIGGKLDSMILVHDYNYAFTN